jgi:hypothetical protein
MGILALVEFTNNGYTGFVKITSDIAMNILLAAQKEAVGYSDVYTCFIYSWGETDKLLEGINELA